MDVWDLDKVCPKNAYKLLQIDQQIDETSRHEMLSFTDAYSEYTYIKMHVANETQTASCLDNDILCYKKNAL